MRNRLLRDNGGEIIVRDAPDPEEEWQLHPVWDDSDRTRAGRTANHVVRETEAVHEADVGLPPGTVVIASNGSGDLIVLLPDDDEPRWWDHESGSSHPVSVEWG